MFLKIWPPAAILDVQKSLFIAFLTISDRYHNLYFCDFFLDKMAAGCPKIYGISGHFRSIGHFGCPKFTFDRISGNFLIFLTKWPPAAILDGTTMSIIELVRDIWMSNTCVKFEERRRLRCWRKHTMLSWRTVFSPTTLLWYIGNLTAWSGIFPHPCALKACLDFHIATMSIFITSSIVTSQINSQNNLLNYL